MKVLQLRSYQEDVVRKAVDYIHDPKDIAPKLIVAPVASGKSIIAAEIALRAKVNIIVFAPNAELVKQNYKKYQSYGYMNAGVFCASLKLKEIKQVTFATIQSAVNKIEDFKDFNVVLIDEAHGVAPGKKDGSKDPRYIRFLEGINVKKVIGMTATPIRMYNNMSGASTRVITNTRPKFFKDILSHVPVSLMIKNGWWSKVKYYPRKFNTEDLRLNSSGNEYTVKSIQRAVTKNDITNKMIKDLRRKPPEVSVLVFAASVQAAKYMHKEFPRSACITTETSISERRKAVDEFTSGKIKIMFNFDCFKEGFDYPELDGIVIGRPTNSLSWYLQVVGRVIRVSPDKKDKWVMDYCGNFKKFGPIENIDLTEIQMKRGKKYEMVKYGGVLVSGIPVVDIGRKVVKDGKIVNVWVPRDIRIPSTIPFGKYAGRPVGKVPTSYLEHLTTLPNCDDWVHMELQNRVQVYR